jgi:phage terminase large subunit-like protein
VISGQVQVHSNGPALWPEFIPLPELEKRRAEVGTPVFETMYQGRRGGLAGEIVKRDYFERGGFYEYAPEGSIPYMAVDLAISKKEQADETAIVVGNVDHRGDLFIRFVWHGRVSSLETAEYLARAWGHYRAVEIAVEAVAYQTALIEIVEYRFPMLPVVPVRPDRDKFSRFLALGALYEFGRVHHHPSLRGSAFEHQLTHLPGGRHDDMADAAAYLADLAGLGSVTVTGAPPEGFR